MVLCLGHDTDVHMAQLMRLPLTVSCPSKSRLALPSWFYLSGAGSPGVVLDKIQEHCKTVVCVVCVFIFKVWSTVLG